MSELFDLRQELFRTHFEKGLNYSDYVATGSAGHIPRWESAYNQVSLTDKQKELLQSFTRTMNILVISGTWCGDCVRQCPMIAKIEEASPKITVRFFDNQQHPELANELRVHGASRVPVAVIASEDFFEVSRFGDRTLSAYRKKAVNEAGVACDAGLLPPDGEELNEQLQEWIDQIERGQLLLRTSGLLRQRYND